MEKELGLPKPGDLLIGVIDVFAVLVPGLIASALVVFVLRRGRMPEANSLSVAGLVIAGWVLGHVLHGIGSVLDPLLYDRLFKPKDVPKEGESQKATLPAKEAAVQKPNAADETASNGGNSNRLRGGIHNYLRKNDELYRLAKEMTRFSEPLASHLVGTSGPPAGMHQWARAWLSTHSPKATSDLDRLEADSKLFRSLAVLFLMAMPILVMSPMLFPSTLPTTTAAVRALTEPLPLTDIVKDYRTAWIVVSFAALLFSLWRYCDLRQKMIRQCYLNYVQLRSEQQK